MGYSQTHKAETHAKLVKLAGRVLRKNGPERLAVVELMHAAGLTHGGFYAHFKSREVLLVEALGGIFEEAQQKYHQLGDGLTPRHALTNFIDAYVSSAHRDSLSGCPIVTLGSDFPRQSRAFRTTFNSGVKNLVSILAGWIDAAGIPNSEALATSILSAMAGTIGVARAVSDKRLSDDVLKTTRETIKRRLSLKQGQKSKTTHKPAISFLDAP
jgi:TetR/AcrR family transcriptional regulator, transcriptional repressor for nem operon